VTVAGVDRLSARFNANAFSGRLEGGYRFVTPWMGITPYTAAQVTAFVLPAYAENVLSGANTFALAYGAKTVTVTRSELGLRSDRSWAVRDAIFTVRGRAAWAHDFNPDRSIAATFQTLPAASFVVNGAVQARDAALTTASAEWKWAGGSRSPPPSRASSPAPPAPTPARNVARYHW
jgi:outer membrane autotransporter protein